MITVKEEFLTSDKTVRARKEGGDAVISMWLAMKTYAASHLTNGFVPDEDIDDLPGAPKRPRAALQCLLDCGRILRDGTRGPGLVEHAANGFQLHDYLEHEQSADDAIERRAARAARQKRWRDGQKRRHVDADVDAAEASSNADVDAPSSPPPSSSLLSSSPASSDQEIDEVARARSTTTTAGRQNKPVKLEENWSPTAKQVAALAAKHEVAEGRILSQVPEFVLYWTEGKGQGKRRSPKGWSMTFGKRIDDQASRGFLYAAEQRGQARPTVRQTSLGSSLRSEADQEDARARSESLESMGEMPEGWR